MEASHKILDLFKDLLVQLPSLLTILACMVFAVTRWKRNPKVSLVVFIGLGLLLLHLLVFSVVYNWVPDLFLRSTSYPNQASVARMFYLVLGLITNIALGVAFAVLLAGIFIQRRSASQQ